MLYPDISRPMYCTHIPAHVRHSSSAFSPDLLCIKLHHTNTHILEKKKEKKREKLIVAYLTGEAVPCKSAWGKIHHLPSKECCIFVLWLTRHFKGWHILYSRSGLAETCFENGALISGLPVCFLIHHCPDFTDIAGSQKARTRVGLHFWSYSVLLLGGT